jgi:hypothetical protein
MDKLIALCLFALLAGCADGSPFPSPYIPIVTYGGGPIYVDPAPARPFYRPHVVRPYWPAHRHRRLHA